MSFRIALIGYGKIAHDEHHPAITASSAFELVALVDPHFESQSHQNSLPCFDSLESLLTHGPTVDAVALCIPPQERFSLAHRAIEAGLHVLLEKPPGCTVAEVDLLTQQARQAGVILCASWHSRHAPAVDAARQWLQDRSMHAVHIDWREDVQVFHPGQTWIWAPGGLGVFDPGINALSIADAILPNAFVLQNATLAIPANAATPIAARLSFADIADAPIHATLDWRHTDEPCWQIRVTTDAGTLRLEDGGARLFIDDALRLDEVKREYDGVYRQFAQSLREGCSDLNLRPLTHVADAFMLGERHPVEAVAM